MTDTERNLPLDEYQRRAEQAISDFALDDGLTVQARTEKKGQDYLVLTATSGQGKEAQAFSYRASQADLENHGDSWFVRRALRSLNDLYRAGKLPAAGNETEHQTLRPLDEYHWTEEGNGGLDT